MVDPKVLEGLSDQDLLDLINKASEKKEQKQKTRVQLINGEVVEGDSPEEVNQILAQRLAAVQNAPVEDEPEPQVTTSQAPKLPKFDQKKFEKTFVEDSLAGQEYLETAQYGMPLKQLLAQMAGALGNSLKKLQELEAQQFIDTNPDYEPSADNRKAIERVMQERGWQTSRQTLEDAFAIAQAKGLIKAKNDNSGGTKQQKEEPWIPPRGNRASEETSAELDLLSKLDSMTDEQVHQLAVRAGIVTK